MKRPCLDCGIPTDGSRCDDHRKQLERAKTRGRAVANRFKYGGDYRGRAAAVRATATRCHICGDGWRAWDPWQADHVVQGGGAGGGSDGPLLPAHRSCNIRRSNGAKKHRKPV
jgi:hypothetical protein